MAIKLIMFDYDGVLVDSLSVVLAIYKKIGNEFNVSVFKNIKDGDFFDLNWKNSLKKAGIINDKDIKNYERFFKKEIIRLNQQITPFPNIKEAIKFLGKNHKLAVVSNNCSGFIKEKLKKHGLLHYFSAIIGAEHGPLKPKPDLLNLCMQKMNVKEQEAVYIGDMKGDITAAKKAKVMFIGTSYGYHSKHKLKGADVVIDTPKKLLQPIMLKNGRRLL